MGECTEVGMYLAMSRQADREGYPEVAEAFKRYAWEEAEHAAKFAELLGDCVWDTKTNLEKRMNAESGACEDKKRIATRAKALNLDAIHDTVHEMAKDEARHGKGFEGLYNRKSSLVKKRLFQEIIRNNTVEYKRLAEEFLQVFLSVTGNHFPLKT